MKDLIKIQHLVGSITEEDLECVDVAVAEYVGIFVPSTGFCKYAISPRHTHPAYMFNIFLEDEQIIIQREIEVPQNSYLSVVLSPELPHEEKMGESFKRYYAVMIHKAYFEKEYNLYTGKMPPKYIWKQFLVNSDIMFYINQFTYEYERNDKNKEKNLEALSMLIAQAFIRSLANTEEKTEAISKDYEIQKVEHYMQQNFGSKITIGELAEKANMSESHFIRTFKKETNLSPMDYLMNVRIEKAKKILKDGTKIITDIALSCGFSSASHFSSSFQKKTGRTPTEYRKKYIEQDYKTK